MKNYIRILNISILNVSLNELLGNLEEGVLLTPNVDHLIKLQRDKEFYTLYQNNKWTICDSKIVFLALKFLRNPVKEVIPGSSFFSKYYTFHKGNPEVRIFLLGAKEGVARIAKDRINAKVGREIIVGEYSPPFNLENDTKEVEKIIKMVNRSGATVLVVGMGAPKQEKWIYAYKKYMPGVRLFMALGATIDFEAGVLKRAPSLFQKLSMEWLYRLMTEPKRLWKRYLVDDFPFIFLIIKQQFGIYKNPFRRK